MPATATPADITARAYRFQRFRTALLIDDLTFGPQAPGPGDRVPAFDLPTLDGGRFSSSDLGGRPVLPRRSRCSPGYRGSSAGSPKTTAARPPPLSPPSQSRSPR